MVQKTKIIKKTNKGKNDDINIKNDINIKIDLENDDKKTKPKPEKNKASKALNRGIKIGRGRRTNETINNAVSGVTAVSNAPKKLGSTKIPSTDTNFNPNTTTNMIVSSALQNALGNRPNFISNPLTPPALPPPAVVPAITAPPPIPAITAPPPIPAITAPPPTPTGTLTIDDIERLATLYIRNQPTTITSSPSARITSVGRKGGILGRPVGSKNKLKTTRASASP